MPDPITLADVRAHIERRILACQIQESVQFHRSAAKECAEAIRHELTEILAMLDRVQPGGSK